ncbi:MAG: hypothetical protein IKW04_03135 [Clostridia bacterium]|nr:hypothetical protein [Clostridia bacterium]
MKTMKRILALLMVATMALSLAACGKKAERADVPIEFDENGNYIVPSVVLELTGWNTQGTNFIMGPDYGYKDVTADWLESKTNVVYKNIYGNDNGSWDAKLDMLVTGGDLPDLVFCGAFQGPAHFNKLDQYDVLYHLDPEVIQKVAPNLWARTPAECWDAFTVTKDGETYITGIPYSIDIRYDEPFTGKMTMNDEEFTAPDFVPYTEDEIKYIRETQKKYETDVTFLSTQCLYVRDDILQDFFPNAASYDELVERLNEKQAPLSDEMMEGINITSTEQLVKFMYDIQKAGYKTDDGKTVYAFGYSGADNWLALSQFGSELMGYKNHNYSGTINWKEEKYELFLLSDIVKEAARIQNQMINDGVIEKESLAQSTGAYEEKVLAGRYAIAAINYFDAVGNVNDQLEASGATFKYRPLIMNIPNDERYPAFYEPTMWMSSLAITTNMKECHVYQLLNWIDQQYTTEWEEIAAWGTEADDLFVDTYEEVTDEEGNTTEVFVERKFKDDRYNKYFIEDDANALGDDETLGLGETSGSAFPIYPLKVTKWSPVILNKCVIYGESGDGGFRFTPDSKHVQNVKEFPLTQIWSSIYADIPEVVEYWSKRETWENAVLSALAAAPGEFEAKWAELERTMNGIIDVKAFEEKCTEAVIDDIKALKEKEAAATEA